MIWRPSWREKRDRERRRSLSVPKQRLGTKRTRCHVCRAPQRKSRRGAGSSHIGPGVGTPWAKRTHHTPPRGAQTQAQLPTPYLGVSQPHAGAGVAPCSPPPPLRPLIDHYVKVFAINTTSTYWFSRYIHKYSPTKYRFPVKCLIFNLFLRFTYELMKN